MELYLLLPIRVHDLQRHDSTLLMYRYFKNGPGSSVGIVTRYGLDGPGIESRWV